MRKDTFLFTDADLRLEGCSPDTQCQYYKACHSRCWEIKLNNNIQFKESKKKPKRENVNLEILLGYNKDSTKYTASSIGM